MQTRHLEYFLALSQTKSMSKVAKHYGISQPALSRAISHLEEDLGYSLFIRNNHGVTLTDMGREILPLVDQLHKDYMHLKSLRHNPPNQQTTIINVACYPTASATIMLDILSQLKVLAPHTILNILQVPPGAVLDMVWQGQCHLGISGEPLESFSDLKHIAAQKDLVISPLYTDELALFLSPQHEVAQWPQIHLAQILNQPFACYKDFFLNHTNPFCQFKNTYGFSDYENVKKLVSENKAITYLPKLLLYKDFYYANRLIIERPLADYQLQLVNYIVYQKTLTMNTPEQILLDTIDQCYSNLTMEVNP